MKNTSGQTVIEYTIITVLLILAIITMTPFLRNSVGAYFKMMDDSVEESFTETPTIITTSQ